MTTTDKKPTMEAMTLEANVAALSKFMTFDKMLAALRNEKKVEKEEKRPATVTAVPSPPGPPRPSSFETISRPHKAKQVYRSGFFFNFKIDDFRTIIIGTILLEGLKKWNTMRMRKMNGLTAC
ncbi:unnamed protein product [Caenorhabditis brenneri]